MTMTLRPRAVRPGPPRDFAHRLLASLTCMWLLGACGHAPKPCSPAELQSDVDLSLSPPTEPSALSSVQDVDGHATAVQHHYGLFNQQTIHYVTAGPELGPKVLLLHGFPEFWYGWRNQIVALATAGYRVIAPDLRGYNRSSKPRCPESYTIARVAEDMVALIEALARDPAGQPQPISLVGHDWGGSAAFRIAYDHPDLLARLFILNIPHPNQIKQVIAHPDRHLQEAIGMLYIQAFVPEGQPEFIFKDLLGFKRSFDLFIYQPMVHRENISRLDRERIYASWSQPGALTAASNYYRVNFEFPKTFPDAPLPKSLPVVLIFGMKDIFMSPSYMDRIDACRVCAETLVVHRIEDASHFVHSDTPRKVNAILLEHLPRLNEASGTPSP